MSIEMYLLTSNPLEENELGFQQSDLRNMLAQPLVFEYEKWLIDVPTLKNRHTYLTYSDYLGKNRTLKCNVEKLINNYVCNLFVEHGDDIITSSHDFFECEEDCIDLAYTVSELYFWASFVRLNLEKLGTIAFWFNFFDDRMKEPEFSKYVKIRRVKYKDFILKDLLELSQDVILEIHK